MAGYCQAVPGPEKRRPYREAGRLEARSDIRSDSSIALRTFVYKISSASYSERPKGDFLSALETLMSALFNFQSLLLVILLVICTCTYVRAAAPGLIDRNKHGFFGLFFKFARIGERLSPYVALACFAMAISVAAS